MKRLPHSEGQTTKSQNLQEILVAYGHKGCQDSNGETIYSSSFPLHTSGTSTIEDSDMVMHDSNVKYWLRGYNTTRNHSSLHIRKMTRITHFKMPWNLSSYHKRRNLQQAIGWKNTLDFLNATFVYIKVYSIRVVRQTLFFIFMAFLFFPLNFWLLIN